jgi:hypothetical protein
MNTGHKLTIQLFSLSSFLCGENKYILVNENENDVTFEGIVSSPGVAPIQIQKITILASEWDNAKKIYTEWLKEQSK